MTATYTWDVFSTLDGCGSYEVAPGDVEWSGYLGNQGPELFQRREAIVAPRQRMTYGATTFREVAGIINGPTELDQIAACRAPHETRVALLSFWSP